MALGRKNYLFAGSDVGGIRAAAIYSLIGSAKINGIAPEAYLAHVLTRIADDPINRIEELLPWRVGLESTEDLKQLDRVVSQLGVANTTHQTFSFGQYGFRRTLT